jgi:L-iditol 2-dehydrogenase
MKAFVYHGEKKFSIDEIEKPVAKAGEAVAKVLCASICGTDLRTYRFGSTKLKPPVTIGHEGCYEIVEAGEGTGLKPGERYTMAPAIGCGVCKNCKRGRTNMCISLETIGYQYAGTFSEYIKIPRKAIEQGHVIKVPQGLPPEVASVAEPVACAINAQSFLNIEKGENVLIYGAGYLGCIHAELALMKGAGKVIIGEVSEKRRANARRLVPEVHVIDTKDAGYAELVKNIVGADGVDVVITACPAGITHKQGAELLSNNGRMSLFGGLPGENNYHIDSNMIHYKELGVFGAHASTVKQNKEALELIASGRLNVEKYITKFAFDDITKAFESLINEDAEKAVLIP